MGVGVWPNGLICDAGEAQKADLTNGDVVSVTVVVGEEYLIFAPATGIVVVGQGVDPNTITNITGVIPPGGILKIKATNVALKLYCADTEEDYGTDFNGSAYVVKVSNNA